MKAWFDRLKVAQKLMLISVFFVMPDTVMLYLFITGINANIEFARMEGKGNEYQRPLEDLLELIPEHQLLTQANLGGNPDEHIGLAEEITRQQTKIDRAFDALQSVDARIGADLQFTDEGLAKRKREHYRVRTVRLEWEDLKTHLAGLDSATCAERHLHLVIDVRAMITHAGDMSNLILDPDLDSYYLMDVTLLALPEMQDRLGAVMAHGAAVLKQPDLSNDERQRFAIYTTLLRDVDLDRVRGSAQTALNEDENFYGVSPTLQTRVPPALKEYNEAAGKFIDLTNRIVGAPKVEVTPQEYLAAGKRARDASFKLWRIADEEVDILLQKRIESYQSRRTKSLLVAAGALLAAIGFVTFITRSISGPLRRQADELLAANRTLQAEIADRISAEAGLRHSEMRLALAQRVAHLGSWEQQLTPQGESRADTLWWSDETFRIFGHEPDARADLWALFTSAVHPDDLAEVLDTFTRAQQNSEPYRIEHRIVLPDGTERIVHEEANTLWDQETGVPVMVTGTVQDVTERRQAEAALREADEKYRAIFDNAIDGIFQNTPEGSFLSANPALARMLGFASPEELIRERNDLERQSYVEPERRREFRRLLEEKGTITNYEYEVKRRDGSVIWVSENVRVVRDSAGKPLYYEGSVQDITERKRAERLVQESEREQRELAAQLDNERARLVAAQAVAKVGSWETDLTTRAVLWSAETYRIFEVDPEEFQPTHAAFLDLVHPDDRAAVSDAFEESLDSEMFYVIEHRVLMRDDRIKFVEERWQIMQDDLGNPVRAIGTAQDVTERKESEEHQHAKDEAERANLAKSEFLSRMSHELRTPLNAILGFGQILEISRAAEYEPESIKMILGAGRHLLKLVDEVLDISRIESGNLELSLEPVPMIDLLREALDIIRPLAVKYGVTLQPFDPAAEAASAHLHVSGDRQRLKQVFLNLLSNAVKYNSAAGSVRVDWLPSQVAGRIRMRVSDSGPDIPLELRPRLFMPFDRLGAERRMIEGTGLGLALSRRLVEAMGGAIGFEGQDAADATVAKSFWVELPQVAGPSERVDAGGAFGQELSATEERLPDARTVLYIEDNLSNLRLIERLLSHFPGVRLLTAMQGGLGLDMARHICPTWFCSMCTCPICRVGRCSRVCGPRN